MRKNSRMIMGAVAGLMWVAALATTVMAWRDGGGVSEWHVLQLPLLIVGGCCGLMAALGVMIAPAKELWTLGYNAGLRDGARAMMSDRVVQLPDRTHDGSLN